MATKVLFSRIDTAANFTTANPILALGETGYEQDTGLLKVGDGVNDWNTLPYSFQGVTDHLLLTNIGTNSHAQIDSHIADAGIHIDWTQPGVGTIDPSNYVDNDTTDHTALSNIGTNTHAQIDSHIADASIHTDWSQSGAGTIDPSNYVDNDTTDHTALSNIGTNTHAQIDSHIADAGIHTDWSQPGAGTIDPSNYVDNDTIYTHPNHSGEVTSTGDGAQVVQPIAITNKPTIAGEAGDFVLVSDTSDSGNLKKVDVNDLLGAVGSTSSVGYVIWAEENGGIANGQREWSFGNGATGTNNLVATADGEVTKAFIQAETVGTTASIDILINNVSAGTATFSGNGVFTLVTPIAYVEGDEIGFQTNTVVGTWSDVRVGARLEEEVIGLIGPQGPQGPAGSSVDTNDVSVTAIGFTSTTFANIPGLSTTVTLGQTGTVLGDLSYSAIRSGGVNAVAEFRVVVNSDNGDSYEDTLSTFNDTGVAKHSLGALAAGTYTVTVQCATSQPITINAGRLTALAVED